LNLWTYWAVSAVLKISAMLLKYLTFAVYFSYFHGPNEYKIRVAVQNMKLLSMVQTMTTGIEVE
jgi:hypothetical protein